MDQLTSSYKKEEIPVDRSKATSAKLKQWQYLEKISKFLGENDNISVDLLIGGNCVETLQPLEVIPSQQDGPYAYRTILGWCVVGPMVDKKLDAVSYNCITVPQLFHFEVQNKCEDIGIKETLMKKLQYPDIKEAFWTDSQAVLGYIANESRKFKIFVANRVKMIKEGSDPSQWFYVSSEENPSDYSSRGVETNNVNAVKTWLEGPSFLWRSASTWNIDKSKVRISAEDPEVKKEAHVYVTSLKDDILSRVENRISNWNKMKRIVGMVLQYKYKLLSKIRPTDHSTGNNNHYFQAANF